MVAKLTVSAETERKIEAKGEAAKRRKGGKEEVS